MPLALYDTHHDVKKDYSWYINHPDEFKRVMANRRRDAVHHMRHYQVPEQPKPVVDQQMTPASEYPTIDVEPM